MSGKVADIDFEKVSTEKLFEIICLTFEQLIVFLYLHLESGYSYLSEINPIFALHFLERLRKKRENVKKLISRALFFRKTSVETF